MVKSWAIVYVESTCVMVTDGLSNYMCDIKSDTVILRSKLVNVDGMLVGVKSKLKLPLYLVKDILNLKSGM